MDFVLLHARGPEHHACCANMTGLATKLRMAASRLESGHGMGAAAWKRVELQEDLHSGAGAVARVDSHDAVPAGHGRQCGSCSHGCCALFGCMRVQYAYYHLWCRVCTACECTSRVFEACVVVTLVRIELDGHGCE